MTGESIRADVRLAVRQSRRNPLFAILTVACLAIGIGANSAIFSVVYAVLLRPLPYNAPDRLMAIWSDNTKAGEPANPVSPANYEAIRALPEFSGVGDLSFLTTGQVTIDAEPEVVNVSTVRRGCSHCSGGRRSTAARCSLAIPSPSRSSVISTGCAALAATRTSSAGRSG
jgi:hypothetical protein